MLLLQEDLARARNAQRLDEAQLIRQARTARAAEPAGCARHRRGPLARATARARVMLAFGRSTQEH